jgi:hypothetical protein
MIPKVAQHFSLVRPIVKNTNSQHQQKATEKDGYEPG